MKIIVQKFPSYREVKETIICSLSDWRIFTEGFRKLPGRRVARGGEVLCVAGMRWPKGGDDVGKEAGAAKRTKLHQVFLCYGND